MKNLLILGDSLSCPRPWEGVGGFDTYAYITQRLLQNRIYVQNLAYSDRCTADYLTESFIKTYIKSANASYIVMQLGIVDCAPRLLTTFERAIGFLARKLTITRSLFSVYIRWKSKHRLFFTKWFPLTRVDLIDYEINVRNLIKVTSEYNSLETFYIVNIAYPGEFLASRSYGILENITRYNQVLYEIAKESHFNLGKIEIIDLFSATKLNRNWVTSEDGHHITSEAHLWIAEQILCTIKNI